MRLSDTIEQFIKTMLAQDAHDIELKRNELAQYFGCAPSQINYVLSTRFTPNHGYLIESHRGGGGYIRIFRIEQDTHEQLLLMLNEQIGNSIDRLSATQLIEQLIQRDMISEGEGKIMRSAISSQALGLPLPTDMKNALRAKILKAMVFEIARKDKNVKP